MAFKSGGVSLPISFVIGLLTVWFLVAQTHSRGHGLGRDRGTS